jgi:hypothetical protein
MIQVVDIVCRQTRTLVCDDAPLQRIAHKMCRYMHGVEVYVPYLAYELAPAARMFYTPSVPSAPPSVTVVD